MRTTLAVLAGAAVAVGFLATPGCVSRKEYDECMAMNRRLKGQWQTALAGKKALQQKYDDLQAELDTKDRLLASKDQKLSVLESQSTEMQANLAKLQEAYDKLKTRMKQPPTFTALPAVVDKALRELGVKHPQIVEYLPQYGMVKFKADLTFDKGSDIVKADAIVALQAFAQVVNGAEAAKFHIYIAGHTDDIPIVKPMTRRRHPNNWYLSVHRAETVRQELEKANVAPSRLGIMGFGEYHPIEPNKPGNKGNPANRRVEIWIVSPGRFMTAESRSAPPTPPPVTGGITK